ncbi:MAG: hypothetical protein HKN26_08615 [Acidimicrobiales bacterium]|nr:hypothetical protein [Acidimicrobiales bacterium]
MNFISSIGARPDAGRDPHRGRLHLSAPICEHSLVKASALMLLADMTSGIAADLDDPEHWHFTTDCSLRLNAVAPTGHVEAELRPLRRGRTTWVDEVDFFDGAGTNLGLCQIGFSVSPLLPDGPPKPDTSFVVEQLFQMDFSPLAAPLAPAAGIEVLDAAGGVLRLEIRDELRQPAGFLQGAIVTLLGEQAAIVRAETDGRPHVVVDMDMRFLVGAMVGPMQTTARPVGAPGADGGRAMAVELVDVGRDRVTTTFLVRTRPVPR